MFLKNEFKYNESKNKMLRVKLEQEGSKLPTYGSEFAAGLDLSSAENVILYPHTKKLVSTGISISVKNTNLDEIYFRIAPRSGISSKYALDVGAGVVDSDYTGIIKVLLFNHGEDPFPIKIGDRIAQLIPERRFKVNVVEVNELPKTERGTNGFGSTG